MSNIRQTSDPLVRAVSVGFSTGYSWRSQKSDWGQLIWATPGTITVNVGSAIWVVPARQLLWLPPAHANSVRMSGRGVLHRVYFARRMCRTMPRDPRVFHISTLLRELLRRALKLGVLHREHAPEWRLSLMILDEIAIAPDGPVELPMPRDARALRAAEVLRSTVEAQVSLDAIAKDAGSSVRTLERLFALETGMSVGEWRRRARLLHAMSLLAEGKSVTEVGLAIGYDSTSAFVAAFRRAFGTTPGQFTKIQPL